MDSMHTSTSLMRHLHLQLSTAVVSRSTCLIQAGEEALSLEVFDEVEVATTLSYHESITRETQSDHLVLVLLAHFLPHFLCF